MGKRLIAEFTGTTDYGDKRTVWVRLREHGLIEWTFDRIVWRECSFRFTLQATMESAAAAKGQRHKLVLNDGEGTRGYCVTVTKD